MFTKKGKRTIVVENRKYYWSATGNDGYINLWIAAEVAGSPKLQCYFGYHQDEAAYEHAGMEGTALSTQFVVTPYIVREAILYGLANGWDPSIVGKDLNLRHLDDKIDMRIQQN